MDRLALQEGRLECEQEASKYQEAAELLFTKLRQYEDKVHSQGLTFKKKMQQLKEEGNQLQQEKEALEKELEELERAQIVPKGLHKVEANLPERSVVFKGHVEEEKTEGTLSDTVAIQPQIRCPIPGGSALITFEDPEVARKIIAMGQHRVQLDEWTYVYVKAEPMTLILPSSVEISVTRSPRQILLSGLPSLSIPEDRLLDKLELFFSKRQNKGGEVERIERLSGSGHVALTFAEDGVAEHLVRRGQFQVPIGKETYTIKVSHRVSGEVCDLQFRPSACAQTVLLSGIPDVLCEELMREALEIHFQKPSKGGGEVEDVLYIPAGASAVAVFTEAKD
ncbi:interferon-induced 35 kDa protein isoform X2 [Sceloporus undulatus]|nr:interferon-induced 35 kDa protein isoform X2 [Sceloporus undulatus]